MNSGSRQPLFHCLQNTRRNEKGKDENLKDIVIPKDRAVFRMDGNGRWHNEHGPFQHKKLIDYFNASIGWDADGFFVSQERGDLREKVYFPCEETALFAVAAVIGDEIALCLNTGRKIRLDSEKLRIKNDQLFMLYQDTLIKFTDRCMMRLAEFIEESDTAFYFHFNGQRKFIPDLDATFHA